MTSDVEQAYAIEICQKAVNLGQPVTFRFAQTEAEKKEAYRLRFKTAVEQAWIKPDDFPDGLEYDRYDERALQIIGWNESEISATSRLILPTPGIQLPTEEACSLQIEPKGDVVDVGRMIVVPSQRSNEHLVHFGLLAFIGRELLIRRLNHVCVLAVSRLLPLYKQIGLQFAILDSERLYWGTYRTPVLINVLESILTHARLS